MALRKFIQENFWLKLISVILAIAFWFIIRAGSQSDLSVAQNPVTNPLLQNDVEIPVHVLSDPADPRIFQITPSTVRVTLTGEAAVLRKLQRNDFKAYVDLTETRRVHTDYEIRLHIPAGITIFSVLPRAVSVEQVSP